MNRRKRLGLCVVMLAILLPPASTQARSGALSSMPGEVGTAALGSDSPGRLVAQGVLLGANGRPVAGDVAALAWPNEEFNKSIQAGDVVPMPTVGWVHVGRNGAFGLRVNPSLVGSRYLNHDGFVNLSIIGWADGYQATWSVTGVIDDSSRLGGEGASPIASVKLSTKTRIHPRTASALARPGQRDVSPAAGGCYQYYTGVSYDAWDVMAETWPYGSHTGNVVLTAGHTHNLGVAISLSGAYGSFSYNGLNSVSTSTTDDFGASIFYRNYQMQSHYQRFNSNCGGTTVKPAYALGYYKTQNLSGYPSWTHCGTAVGQWTRADSTGNAYTISTGVKLAPFIGLDVTSSTQYSTTRTMTYYHAGTYHVCGNDNAAGLASKVESAP
jgi:hypothetical protein